MAKFTYKEQKEKPHTVNFDMEVSKEMKSVEGFSELVWSFVFAHIYQSRTISFYPLPDQISHNCLIITSFHISDTTFSLSIRYGRGADLPEFDFIKTVGHLEEPKMDRKLERGIRNSKTLRVWLYTLIAAYRQRRGLLLGWMVCPLPDEFVEKIGKYAVFMEYKDYFCIEITNKV